MCEDHGEVSLEIVRQAKARALKILEYADRTEKQLRDKLKEGEFPPFAIDEAVDYVQKLHYQDDVRYAESFIRGRVGRKSAYEIRQELQQRGISKEVAEQDLLDADIEESDTVKALFLKKYGTKDLSDPAVYQKAFRYFAGKGFGYEVIRDGIRRGIEASEDGEMS